LCHELSLFCNTSITGFHVTSITNFRAKLIITFTISQKSLEKTIILKVASSSFSTNFLKSKTSLTFRPDINFLNSLFSSGDCGLPSSCKLLPEEGENDMDLSVGEDLNDKIGDLMKIFYSKLGFSLQGL
jgi:hypothetical protein